MTAPPPEKRIVLVSALSIGIALGAGVIAQVLGLSIAFVTNLAFYGRISTASASPADHHLGVAVIVVPVVGGLLVGAMARWGSKAIRGHGIPEAMEQVLYNESRIPARMTFLKPLSAAIAIGTGGPFGAEGPIIATGGALGSLVGQIAHVTADERKTLLCAGAAAGMTATFGTPIAAVLLAVELLLFEYRSRSMIPVALASATAAAVRGASIGWSPVFPMPTLAAPSSTALVFYACLGGGIGCLAVLITRAVYGIEDLFEKLPIHWMWWPAMGAAVVGIVGYFVPHTMGVGYDNIENVIGGRIVGTTLFVLCVAKFISWVVALGSGTSGGTLAPLFTVGGAVGALVGGLVARLFPSLGVDPRIGALVGMASMFAGASHATLASVVFAFETTRQPVGLLPLLAGCTAAYLVSSLAMRTSIMTEKIARRGLATNAELTVDPLSQSLVSEYASKKLVTLRGDLAASEARAWLASAVEAVHGAYPVLDPAGALLGIVTRHAIRAAAEEKRVAELVSGDPSISETATLRDAADTMLREDVGRLAVLDEGRLVGIISRRDLLRAHRRRLANGVVAAPSLTLRTLFPRS